jgi:AbiV family abortive infection protein
MDLETAMSEENTKKDEDVIAAMQACTDHARDLLTGAKAVQASGKPNIAFHLATLCLEEIGRRALLAVQDLSSKAVVPPAWPQKHEQDHIKKLWWCFFDGMFLNGQVTGKRLEDAQALAREIHLDRLAGLYVAVDEDGLHIPRDAITKERCGSLIEVAEARLQLVEAEKRRENIPQEEIELQAWFLSVTDNPDLRRQIMSGGSMKKLAELGNVVSWGKWLKEQFARAEAEGRAMLQKELERSQNLPSEKTKDKWRLRVRIHSASHSIRPASLRKWNEGSEWIKLHPVSGKKNQLDIDFIIGDNVPLDALWFFGWGLARAFVMALNIGTLGFWWWRLPEFVSSYYESLHDLETNSQIQVARNPLLVVDWGKNRVLTEADLHRVAVSMSSLPPPGQDERHKPFNFYIGGVTFLSLNDVHWQCEAQAYGNFHQCLKALMEAHGDLAPGGDFCDAFLRFIKDAYPTMDDEARFKTLCTAFEKNSFEGVVVKLDDAAIMKTFCDLYFHRKVISVALQGKAEGQ